MIGCFVEKFIISTAETGIYFYLKKNKANVKFSKK